MRLYYSTSLSLDVTRPFECHDNWRTKPRKGQAVAKIRQVSELVRMVLTEGCKRCTKNVIYFCALFYYKNSEPLVTSVSEQGKEKSSYCSPQGCSLSVVPLFSKCIQLPCAVLERPQSSEPRHLAALQPGVSARADLQTKYTFTLGRWFKTWALPLSWCQRGKQELWLFSIIPLTVQPESTVFDYILLSINLLCIQCDHLWGKSCHTMFWKLCVQSGLD